MQEMLTKLSTNFSRLPVK